MSERRAATRFASSTARRWALALEGLTTVGVVAGIQGFLTGQFDPLVDQLPVVDGPVVPARQRGSHTVVALRRREF
jgi:hypothetical protein